METWTIKVDDAFAKEIERVMKPMYMTKTEFIREALRKHVKDLEKEDLKKQLKALIKIPEKKTTLAELRKIREEVWNEYAKEKGLKHP